MVLLILRDTKIGYQKIPDTMQQNNAQHTDIQRVQPKGGSKMSFQVKTDSYTWQSESMRKERYRITVGSGENISMICMLGWGSSAQTMSIGMVETEVVLAKKCMADKYGREQYYQGSRLVGGYEGGGRIKGGRWGAI